MGQIKNEHRTKMGQISLSCWPLRPSWLKSWTFVGDLVDERKVRKKPVVLGKPSVYHRDYTNTIEQK